MERSVFLSLHVGGLWRSDDRGETWAPALELAVEVHQVAATRGRPWVTAARAFAWSHDGGLT